MTIDLNSAGKQRSFELIPADTIATAQMMIRPGGVGEGGWLKRYAGGAVRASTSNSSLSTANMPSEKSGKP